MRSNAWGVALLVGSFAVQFYVVSAYGATADDALYTWIGWGAVAGLLAGLLAFRPRPLAGWGLVGVAMVLYLVGDAVYASLAAESAFVAVPSTADWIYLSMYPVLAAGLLVIGRAGRPRHVGFDRRSPKRILDTAIVTLSVGGTLGVVYAADLATNDFLTGTAQWVAVGYPAGDLLLVAVVTWLVADRIGRTHDAAVALLAAAVAALVVGNAVYNVAAAGFSYAPGGLADAGWLTFTTLLAVAVLHPDGNQVAARTTIPAGIGRARRTTAVGSTVVAMPVVAATWGAAPTVSPSWGAIVAAIGLFVVRLVGDPVLVSPDTFVASDRSRPATT